MFKNFWYAVEQSAHIEVHQETLLEPEQFEVRNHLRLMNRHQSVHALELDEQPVSDKKIDAVAAVDSRLLVQHRHRHFLPERDFLEHEFVAQAARICGLEQARARYPFRREAIHVPFAATGKAHFGQTTAAPWLFRRRN